MHCQLTDFKKDFIIKNSPIGVCLIQHNWKCIIVTVKINVNEQKNRLIQDEADL